jgi:hypothetical protein
MGFATFRASMSMLQKQHFEKRSPLWRHTLRSLSPDHSRTVSPRPTTFSPFQRARPTGATRKRDAPDAWAHKPTSRFCSAVGSVACS